MPSFEKSAAQRYTESNDYSYDKILATFRESGDDTSVFARQNKISVTLKDSTSFFNVVSRMDEEDYKHSAGSDLSALLLPFKSKVRDTGHGEIPSFFFGASADNQQALNRYEVTRRNLVPFEWQNQSTTTSLKDRWSAPSGDGLGGLISSDKHRISVDQYRDLTDVRGIGLRLPIIGVGWGYTLSDHIAMPSGTADEVADHPSGTKVFRGGVTEGWQVDPSDYIAAPIDFRYDRFRHVWTCAAGGPPPGSGLYKALTLINSEFPGVMSWDYHRFPPNNVESQPIGMGNVHEGTDPNGPPY